MTQGIQGAANVLCCKQPDCCRNVAQQDARVPQDRVGNLYDRIAPVYDIWGRLTESRARNRALELAHIDDGQNVLEVAAGTGLAFREIVKRNPSGRSTGLDLSSGMLRKARRRLAALTETGYTLEQGDAFDLPVATGSVDLLVNNYMFDLIPDQDMGRILDEFARVLKADGKLILVNMTHGETAPSRLYEHIYRMSPKTMGGCRGVVLSDRLEAHGFVVETREYHQQMLFPSEVISAHRGSAARAAICADAESPDGDA